MKVLQFFALGVIFIKTTYADPPTLPGWEEGIFDDTVSTYFKITCQNQGPEALKCTATIQEEIDANETLAILKHDGVIELTMTQDSEYFQFMDGYKILGKSSERLDYEETQSVILFIAGGGIAMEIKMEVININDNEMKIVVKNDQSCKIEERMASNTLVDDCTYVIQDPDGFIDQIDIIYTDDNFKIDYELNPSDDHEQIVTFYSKKEFDYETRQMYFLEWTVDDKTHTATSKAMINIVDINDEKAKWIDVLPMLEIVEESEEPITFSIEAIDGDFELNTDITFTVTNEGKIKDQITYTQDKNKLIFKVAKIDRDEEDLDMETLFIEADKMNCNYAIHDSCKIDQTIILVIKDINDNVPKITVSSYESEINEQKSDGLSDLTITIKDFDLAENGTFDVTLFAESNLHKAFIIIPSKGYRSATFQIVITNSALLDYDIDENIRNFDLQVIATEPHNSNCAPISIRLKNLNDEIPYFKNSTYEISIPETFGRLSTEILDIPDLIVQDHDADDALNIEILGLQHNEILNLVRNSNSPHPIIEELFLETKKSNMVQIFDYEREKLVVVQLQVTDNGNNNFDKNNTIIQQITINVDDVNDESPRIMLNETSIKVTENSANGTTLNVELEGTDADLNADLHLYIDWDNTYATKNSVNVTLDDYRGFVEIHIIDKIAQNKATLVINEILIGATPDYEEFHEVHLRIVLEDLNQEVGDKSTSANLVLMIENINDNDPEFLMDTINSPKEVKENADPETRIAIITAIDKDGNEITYKLDARNGTKSDLVNIDEKNGEVYVVTDNIDADDGPIYSLYYTVWAFDGIFNTPADIEIIVIDLNDNDPYFEVFDKEVSICEHSCEGKRILQVVASDKDRDEKNNKINYDLDGDGVERFFGVNDEGLITFVGNPKDLDRDEGKTSIKVIIKISNDRTDNGPPRTDSTELTVTLLDINDNAPIILTESFNITENIKKNELIGTFDTEDKDEEGTNHTKINFEITYISGGEKNVLMPHDLYVENETLKTNIDLANYYGVYTITIETCNPQSQLQCTVCPAIPDEMCEMANIVTLNIDKYNFRDPAIRYPGNNENVYFKPGLVGQPLKLFNNAMFEIEATDNQGEKYKLEFSIKDEFDNFKIRGNQIILNKNINQENGAYYEVKLEAYSDGLPSRNHTITFTIRYLDIDSDPFFKVPSWEMEKPIEEGKIASITFPEAVYANIEIEDELDIFYHLIENYNDIFEIKDSKKPILDMINTIELDECNDPTKPVMDVGHVKVYASNNVNGSDYPSNSSILTISLKVEDVNNNSPTFHETAYKGGVTARDKLNALILTIKASDKDCDALTYEINKDSLNNNVDDNKTPFNLVNNNNTGELKLNFQVNQKMEGFIEFNVIVNDRDQKHSMEAKVVVHVIGEKHSVPIQFENEVEDVRKQETQIRDILKEQLKYEAVIDAIDASQETLYEISEPLTDVFVHFVNEDESIVDGDEIRKKMVDISIYRPLRQAFLTLGLSLKNAVIPPSEDPKTNERIFLIAMISVAAISGCLVVAVVGGCIYKTRSLNNRIKKLTTTDFVESDETMHKATLPAPNTNRHVEEQSNPKFDDDEPEAVDNKSISSNDSDFIGVEENPVFQLEDSIEKNTADFSTTTV